jgi:tetratricopeptide (TPR) repeat protein
MILEPVYATNWANLGLLEWASGDYSAALKDLKKAVVTAPEQPAFKLTYGRMLEMDERPDEAKIVYRQVLDSVPSWASTYFFRASPLRLAVIKKWRSETNPQENNEVIAPSPTSIEISGFGLANNESIANNNLALGISLTQQGDFKDAITAIKSGLDLFDQTTSFGVGQMGNSQYGWSIFNRESIDADILSGLDYPVYTDDVVKMMLVLADDYQKIGDKVSASQVYEKILRVAPDCQPAIEKLK